MIRPGPALRRVPWRQIAGAAWLGALVLVTGARRADSVNEVLPLVRIAALTVATTSVTALDDPAAPVTHSSPPGRWRLRIVASALTFVVVVALWATSVVVADTFVEGSLRSVVTGASIELLAMFCAGLAIGSTIDRATSVRLAPAWGAAMLVMTWAVTLTQVRLRTWLWVEPGPHWRAAHVHWALLAAISAAVFAWSSRDPASRRTLGVMNRAADPARQRHDVSS